MRGWACVKTCCVKSNKNKTIVDVVVIICSLSLESRGLINVRCQKCGMLNECHTLVIIVVVIVIAAVAVCKVTPVI